MKAYNELVRLILDQGKRKSNRTGIDTISLFGQSIHHRFENGFPLLTGRELHWKSIVHELLWFISGSNRIDYLRENNVTIWDEWVNEDGTFDSPYGFFWREFPSFYCETHKEALKCYKGNDCITEDWGGTETDQLTKIIEELKVNPNSRRLLCSAWEPNNAWNSKLPPCHHAWNLYHIDGKLSICVSMRSTDVGLGLPFNLASYSLLLYMICKEVNMIPDQIVINMCDAHIYVNHVDALEEQISRSTWALPRVNILCDSVVNCKYDDIELIGYCANPKIKMEIAV